MKSRMTATNAAATVASHDNQAMASTTSIVGGPAAAPDCPAARKLKAQFHDGWLAQDATDFGDDQLVSHLAPLRRMSML